MSGPSFLFSFYALLLGLALTQVISGFSRALDQREDRPIGWLTPLLALVLTLDLLTFYAGAWASFRDVNFEARMLVTSAVGPVIYYFAATQLFPRETEAHMPLDEHFFAHRKWVVGGVILANMIDVAPSLWLLAEIGGLDWSLIVSFFGNLIYLAGLAAVALLRIRRAIIAILIVEIIWLFCIIWFFV